VGERREQGVVSSVEGGHAHLRARECPVRVLARAGTFCASLSVRVLGNVDVSCGQSVHGRDQQGQGKLKDMVAWPGWERRE
jgi:hypothetical protein